MPDHGDTTIVGGEGQSRPRATPTTIERGEQVGRYVVLEQLGRGGMGVVYAAYDPELDRKVALKLLHAQLHTGVDTSEGRPRLLREAQALAKLAHPNVITIHDVGTVAAAVSSKRPASAANTLPASTHGAAVDITVVASLGVALGASAQAARSSGRSKQLSCMVVQTVPSKA